MAKNRFSDGPGPSQRQLRVGELIRRTLSDVLNRGDIHDPDLNAMSITVSEVRASPDLRIATAYVLPLGGGNRELAIQALKRNKSELRRAISKGMTLKFAPDLRFLIDETFDRMDETRALFDREEVRRDVQDDEDDMPEDDAEAGDGSGEGSAPGTDDDRSGGDVQVTQLGRDARKALSDDDARKARDGA